MERYRVVFNDIPTKEDRDKLKSLGFRYSPKSQEWLQYLTGRGRERVLALIEYFKETKDV